MLIHNHQNPNPDEGQLIVLHIDRSEAVDLVKAVSTALSSNPDNENFAITLGVAENVVEEAGTDGDDTSE